MLDFTKEMIFTGAELKKSKENKEYVLVNFLNENGSSFGTVCECPLPQNLKQLDKVTVNFLVVPGRYTQLKTLDIKKV